MHTSLTANNFYRYALVLLSIDLLGVGFSTINLCLISPFGAASIAAIGQGQLILTGISALLFGFIDIYRSRLATAEGENTTAALLGPLITALAIIVIFISLVSFSIVYVIDDFVTLIHQAPELQPAISDYITIRLITIPAMLIYAVSSESLKICGMKSLAIYNLCGGFVLNVVLGYVFLYTDVNSLFSSPTNAMAFSTTITQLTLAVSALSLFMQNIVLHKRHELRFSLPEIKEILIQFITKAPGISVRHFNDHMGTIVPLLFIGTMNVAIVASANIATQIYILFCRIPQACFNSGFIFYSYHYKSDNALAAIRQIITYCALPTFISYIVILLLKHELFDMISDVGVNYHYIDILLTAYLIFVPFYFFEQLYGELLTVHQHSAVIFFWSTLTTYIITIPLSYAAVFIFESAFWAIAAKGAAICILAIIFYYKFHSANAMRKQ